MNLNRVIQSILIMLAVVGVFAAMARNAYGFDFIGVACFALSLLFLVQLVWKAVGEYGSLHRADIPEMVELFLLSILTLLFGLRAFYIYVDYGEIIFNAVCVLQMVVYGVIGYALITSVSKESKPLGRNLIFFYSSLGLFLLSLVFRTRASLSMALGLISVLVAIPFLIYLLRQQQHEIKSKSVTLLQFIIASKNKAGLLFMFFVSSALFTILSYWGIIPSIENVDRPKDYIELINNAETGKEKPVDGQYQHEVYKNAMEKFLERHQGK